MPDVRRTYGGPTENLATAAKPAYFYYTPAQQEAARPRQPAEQFYIPQQRGQLVDERGRPIPRAQSPVYGTGPRGTQKLVAGQPAQSANMGEFHQQPDGTIVMVQPTPVDPYGGRIRCLKFVVFGANVILLVSKFTFSRIL